MEINEIKKLVHLMNKAYKETTNRKDAILQVNPVNSEEKDLCAAIWEVLDAHADIEP